MGKKIMIFSPDLGKGGEGKSTSRIATYLANSGYSVSVLLYDNVHIHQKMPKCICIKKIGFPLWKNFGETKQKRYFRGIIRWFLFPVGAFCYLQKKSEQRPEVVISNSLPMNVIACIMKSSEKLIIVDRNFITDNYRKKLFMRLILKIAQVVYNKADFVVGLSEPISRQHKEIGVKQAKIKTISNFIPKEEVFEKIEEKIPSNALSKVLSSSIITVGRLAKQKGHWHLLRVFSMLREDVQNIKLVILGDGELREYLVSLSRSLGLKTYAIWEENEADEKYDVYFLGFQENPYKFLSKSKLFVLSSLFEGFPNVLVEAMICGIPVISADCRSGPREILAPDTDPNNQTNRPEFAEYGILLPTFSGRFEDLKPLDEREQVWAEIFGKILRNEEILKEYAKKASVRAADFSSTEIIPKWIALIEDVADTRRIY